MSAIVGSVYYFFALENIFGVREVMTTGAIKDLFISSSLQVEEK
jgi:hypothetical protein